MYGNHGLSFYINFVTWISSRRIGPKGDLGRRVLGFQDMLVSDGERPCAMSSRGTSVIWTTVFEGLVITHLWTFQLVCPQYLLNIVFPFRESFWKVCVLWYVIGLVFRVQEGFVLVTHLLTVLFFFFSFCLGPYFSYRILPSLWFFFLFFFSTSCLLVQILQLIFIKFLVKLPLLFDFYLRRTFF